MKTASFTRKNFGMAYLPGERPLIDPWNEQITVRDSQAKSPSSILNVSVGIAGLGSAYVECGMGHSSTKLIVSVRGPRQQPSNRSSFDVETTYASFAAPGDSRHDISKDISAFMKEAIEGSICLDLYPQSSVTLHVKILQGGTCIHSTLPSAIVAASIACIHAGLQMRDRVLAVCLAINGQSDFHINPDKSMISTKPCATVAIMEKSRMLSLLHISGGGIEEAAGSVDSLIDVADQAISDLSISLASRFNI